jgi:putative spermidine/putrescine transport system substrate-binding protein
MTSTFTRRTLLKSAAAGTALIAAPWVANAQAATLKITTWGGKWGDVMKGEVLPAFEKEMNCKIEADQAFPYIPKLAASPAKDPLYDVLHANSNEQWLALEQGLVMEKIAAKEVPNIKEVYPYAVSERIVGVTIFTSAVGLGFRTDRNLTPLKSWKDFADPKFAGQRGGYQIPVNSLGQAHFMLLGQLYGKGMTDLDAAYKALEQLKPMKLVDFTGQMEKMLLQGEVSVGIIHDSGIYRYDGQAQPVDFVAPVEGVLSLEQVLNVTPGTKVKELAFAYIDFMLRPDIQKKLAEAVWYSPANKNVKLDSKYDAKLYNTPEKVAQLIQVDWKWFNARKDEIDARVARLMRG